ncbi:MAG TPA: metal ABC transporter substrate-binding protein [Acidimicrobiales bacterium]|nr:metal ABC transporter substrate-binding protein [Acidimicrobiales bacterium]
MRSGRVVASVVALLLVAGACGSSGDAAPAGGAGGGKLKVVTTVSPITNIAANIGGDLVEIDGVVPEGTNSHTFEPPPSVAEVLSEADLIFVNGLKLEDPTLDLAEKNKKSGAKIVSLGDAVLPEDDYIYDFSFPEEEGKPNPHLWTDPTYAKRYAEVIKDELSAADEDNAAAYEANYEKYSARIDAFDEALRESTATIPVDDRKLVTYHDAYAYFAKTYGWKIVGAIQVESFEDPTPKEVADLIDQIESEGVKAIFGSEVFPSPVLQQIGKETGVRYIDELRDDDLPGKPGDREHTLLSLLRYNFTTMIEALGGDPSALADVDVSDVVADRATYPQ